MSAKAHGKGATSTNADITPEIKQLASFLDSTADVPLRPNSCRFFDGTSWVQRPASFADLCKIKLASIVSATDHLLVIGAPVSNDFRVALNDRNLAGFIVMARQLNAKLGHR